MLSRQHNPFDGALVVLLLLFSNVLYLLLQYYNSIPREGLNYIAITRCECKIYTFRCYAMALMNPEMEIYSCG